ncbi:coiled-coil domain-containing protein 22 homolog isoform X2 [Halichondria panicea]|uniref:coiled-coil domain-containing protein 22 homolog isoform X2 n=1 Tax=Halichondria panicea TaxID=6063 RepID=UPI00312B38E6
MEEVDNIIITTLKEIGCNLDEEVTGLQGFSADHVVEACVRCLRLINSEFKSSTHLPEAMSSRYRMCTSLANTIQALGYPGEIGYQTFLYSSIKEWRKLLMFLLEKLPRENAQTSDEPTGTRVMLGRVIAAELSLRLQSPWTPALCKKESTAWSGNSSWLEGTRSVHAYHGMDVQAPTGTADLTVKLPKDLKQYYNRHMPYMSAQLRIRKDVLSSLLEKNANEVAAQQEWEAEWNQLGLSSRLSEEEYRARKKQKLQKKLADQLRTSLQQGRTTASAGLGLGSDLQTILNSFADKGSEYQGTGSRFQHAEKLQFALEDDGPQVEEATEEELQQRREEELTGLQDQLADLTSKLELLDLNMKKYKASMGQMGELQTQGATKNKEEEEAYKVKKKTFDLLPNADENITKLKELIQKSADRLALLSSKWEEIRGPLMNKYRTLKADSENKESESTKLLEEIRFMRERMKELADETRLKDDLYKQLVAEYERMAKDVSRTSYTRRIMEIVANIQRQKEDIGKVLQDMRMVQKEINSLTGRLERVFTVTDEQVYKGARKDEARRAAYKLLANIRDGCELVVEAIKDTGQIKREQRDLEEQSPIIFSQEACVEGRHYPC